MTDDDRDIGTIAREYLRAVRSSRRPVSEFDDAGQGSYQCPVCGSWEPGPPLC